MSGFKDRKADYINRRILKVLDSQVDESGKIESMIVDVTRGDSNVSVTGTKFNAKEITEAVISTVRNSLDLKEDLISTVRNSLDLKEDLISTIRNSLDLKKDLIRNIYMECFSIKLPDKGLTETWIQQKGVLNETIFNFSSNGRPLYLKKYSANGFLTIEIDGNSYNQSVKIIENELLNKSFNSYDLDFYIDFYFDENFTKFVTTAKGTIKYISTSTDPAD